MTFPQYLRRLRQLVGPGRPARRARRPGVECLEDRTLLSVTGTYLGQLSLAAGPATNVSRAPQNQSEQWIAINPHNPANMIAAPNDDNGLSQFVDNLWVTRDGGATWTEITAPAPAGFISAGDPDLIFDSSGRAIFAHLVEDPAAPPPNNLFVASSVSSDGGLHWQSALADVFNPNHVGDDKELMAIGPDALNPGQQRIYMAFQRAGIQFVTSSPDGLAWTNPVQVSGGCDETNFPFTGPSCGIAADPVVLPNGHVTVAWEDFGTSPGHGLLTVASSVDDGIHWTAPKVVYTSEINVFNDPSLDCASGSTKYCIPAQPTRGIGDFVHLSADLSGGPHNGRMYLSFTDAPGSHNDTNVYVMRSDDGGTTWSAPVKADDDPTDGTKNGHSQFNAAMEVDQTTGDVALAWYDARNSPGNSDTQFFGTISTDGGQTFEPNVAISPGQSNASDTNTGFDWGEYAGLAFFGGSFFPLWADNSNSTGDNLNGTLAGANIYTAPVTVQAAGGVVVNVAANSGSPAEDDQWYINRDASGRFIQFWENDPTLAGVPTYTATFSQVSAININGGAGANTVTLDFSNGSPVPNGGILINGGTTLGAANTLVLRGGQYTDERTFLAPGAGTITFDNGGAPLATITLNNVSAVDDTIQTNTAAVFDNIPNDTVSVADFGGTLNGLPTATSLTSSGGPISQTLNFAAKGAVTLDLTGGGDTVTVNHPTPTFGDTTLLIDATNPGNVGNLYNLQALGVPATVNGGGGDDTFTLHNAAGSLAGIVKPLVLNGQAGTNTLNATNDSNFTLSNTALVFGRAVNLSNIQVANLTGGPGGSNFTITNWSGGGSLTGVGGTNSVTAGNDVDYTLTNTSLARSGLPAMALSGIQQANLSGGASNNNFDVGGWTGTGSLNGGGGTDTVTATKDTTFTLTNTGLVTGDGMSLALNAFSAAALTGGTGDNTFDVSGWTGQGILTGGGGSDTVIATKDTTFTLADATLASGDGMDLTLSGIGAANLTGGPGNNTFDVSGWHGTGSLTGGGGADTVVAAKNTNFALSDTALAAGDGLNLTLSGIGTAVLTGGTGDNGFAVGTWTGNGTLTGGGGSDTINATKDVNFTLSDTSLKTSDGMSLALVGFGTANLTGGGGDNTFTVSGWNGAGTFDGKGGTNTIVAADDVNFTLTNTSLARTALPTLTLVNIGVANLTGGPTGNTFDVSGWTGTGSLAGGGGSDTITATKDRNFFLSDTGLSTNDGMNLALSGIHTALLTGGASANSFTVGTFTGTGTLTGVGGNDVVNAAKDADFILADGSLSSTDGMMLTLNGITTANLTGGPANDTFTVSGWSGGGSLDGQGGTDTVIATNNTDFTLTNTALIRAGLPTLTLANVEDAVLTGGTGDNTFNLDGWTGGGSIIGGGGNDTVTVTRNTSFTLSNTLLSSSDGMAMGLSGIFDVKIGDGAGNNRFDVSGWTGSVTLTSGGGSDTVAATKDANFTLADGSLQTSDGLTLTLNGITAASLTGGPGNNRFDVSGWTGTGTLAGGGGSDTITATKNTSFFSLSDTALSSGDGMSLTLIAGTGLLTANLTSGAANTLFAVGVWSGTGTLKGDGTGQLTVTKNTSTVTLADTLLSASDGTALTLSGIHTAALTGGPGNNLFDISGWSGDGSIDGQGGTNTVAAHNDTDFTLTNTSLARDGFSLFSLTNIKSAVLTGGLGNSHFDVSGWTGTGSLTGGGGSDTVIATKDTTFSLADSALSSGDGMSLALSGIRTALLTGGTGNNTFTLGAWTGGGTLTGGGGSDSVVATKNADFTLTNGTLSSSDGMVMGLVNIGAAGLTGGAGNNTFDVSGWTGPGTVTGGGGSDTITATKGVNFSLSNTALTAGDGLNLTLSGLAAANLTDTGNNHTFAVGNWTGGGLLAGGGNDTVTVTKDANFTLGDTSLATSDNMNLALSGIRTASLTGGAGNNSFNISGWTGAGSLNGGSGGTDTVIASNDTNFTLTSTQLGRGNLPSFGLANIASAVLTGGAGNNTFVLGDWTGGGTLTGGGGGDTVVASKDVNFTLGNSALSSSDGMSLALNGIGTADLTGGTSGNFFDVSGWTHGGSVTGGGGSDTIAATKDANFTLTDASLMTGDGMNLTLLGIGAANLTGGGSNNTFLLTNWSGGGSLDGQGGNDTLDITNDTDFNLTSASLARAGLPTLALNNIEAASLIGGTHDNTFNIGNWAGSVSLTGGGGNDAVAVTRDTNFTLGNNALTTTDGLSVALDGIGAADLTGGTGGNAFDVSAWTGTGTLAGAGGNDVVTATKDANFTLADTALSSSDQMNLALVGITTANLTGGPSANTFRVDGWTGSGSLTGSNHNDTVSATKGASFTLTNTSLASSDHMNLALSGIDTADLTGGLPSDTFDVSGWTGHGTLTGGASNTVVASKNTSFTLSNTSLHTGDGMTLGLAGLGAASLTGGPGNNNFDVGGWTGSGSLTGGGGTDTVTAANDTSFTLSNTALTAADNLNLALNGFTVANLGGGAGNNNFDVSGWTHTGTVTGGGGSDTIIANKAGVTNDAFTLTNAALATGDGMSLALNAVGAANLTGGTGNDTFTVSGWTGGGTLTGGGGSDSVTATKDRDFSLSNTALTASDGLNLTLGGVRAAGLTGGSGNNNFAVGNWTGSATLTGGGGSDSVSATKDADFTLTNQSLTTPADGMSLALNAIGTANLTGGSSANTFDVSAWTGNGMITGGANGNPADRDVVVKSKDTSFTLTDASLATGDHMVMGLSGVGAADLTGGAGGNAFEVGGWSGAGFVTGGGGSDTVTATRDTNFTLSNGSLSDDLGLDLNLTGVSTAGLTGGGGNNSFNLTGWTGTASLDGMGGVNTVVAQGDINFTLTNATLFRGGAQPVSLHNIQAADLTGGAGSSTFDVSGWTGGGLLNGGSGGSDRVIVTRDASFGLSDTAVSDSAGLSMGLLHVPAAVLTGGPGPDAYTVSGWSGTATLNGGVSANSYAVTFKGSGNGTVTVNDSGVSGASSLTVSGPPGGGALTAGAGQVTSGGETVRFGGIATEAVRGGAGPNTITVDTTPTSNLNLSVDGGPSGANTLSVVDVAGGATLHGSVAAGAVTVMYPQGVTGTITFTNIQNLQLTPDASHSYVQAVYEAITGQPAGAAQLNQGVGQLNVPGGRTQLVKSLELSQAGRQHLVNTWFLQYAGRPASSFEMQRYGNLLAKHSEEQVLSQVILQIFRGPAAGSATAFLQLAGQALFGRPLTLGELRRFRKLLQSGGRAAAVQAMLKTLSYRLPLVLTYLRQLLHVPAGQPLNPSLQALASQLARSKKDERSIRIFLETSDVFFAQA
jgi:hypothetical protein